MTSFDRECLQQSPGSLIKLLTLHASDICWLLCAVPNRLPLPFSNFPSQSPLIENSFWGMLFQPLSSGRGG